MFLFVIDNTFNIIYSGFDTLALLSLIHWIDHKRHMILQDNLTANEEKKPTCKCLFMLQLIIHSLRNFNGQYAVKCLKISLFQLENIHMFNSSSKFRRVYVISLHCVEWLWCRGECGNSDIEGTIPTNFGFSKITPSGFHVGYLTGTSCPGRVGQIGLLKAQHSIKCIHCILRSFHIKKVRADLGMFLVLFIRAPTQHLQARSISASKMFCGDIQYVWWDRGLLCSCSSRKLSHLKHNLIS